MKEEDFKQDAPQKRGKKTIYIKKVVEEDKFQIPHANLLMLVGIIAFVFGMGLMAYIQSEMPKSYSQDIIDNGIRFCYVDKCFYWFNCTSMESDYIGDELAYFCRQTCKCEFCNETEVV